MPTLEIKDEGGRGYRGVECDGRWNIQLSSSLWLCFWTFVDLHSSWVDDEIIFEINSSEIETSMASWSLKLNVAMFI